MRSGMMVTVTGEHIRLRYKKPGPKPLPEGVKKRRVNICLSPHWHERGKAMAAANGMSLSKYIEQLVYADSLCNESA